MVSFKSHMTLNFNKYTLLEVLAKVQEWAGNSRDQIIPFSYKKKKGFSLKIQIMSDIDIFISVCFILFTRHCQGRAVEISFAFVMASSDQFCILVYKYWRHELDIEYGNILISKTVLVKIMFVCVATWNKQAQR